MLEFYLKVPNGSEIGMKITFYVLTAMTTDLDVRDKKVQVAVQVHQIVIRRKSWREVMAIEVHLNNVWKGTVT